MIRITRECKRCPGPHYSVESCNSVLRSQGRECAAPEEHHKPKYRIIITVRIG